MSNSPIKRTRQGARSGAVLWVLAGVGLFANPSWARPFDPDHYQSLASDRRAVRVGETLTVIVLENTRASSRAATEASDDMQISVDARERDHHYSVGAGVRGENSGAGGTSRSGEVRAQLAVRVLDLETNGMLRISGEQVLTVNGEAQTIRLSGVVRADDVSADNTVLSNRIGDAHIEFTGRGVVSDAQRQNVIFRVLRWLRLV